MIISLVGKIIIVIEACHELVGFICRYAQQRDYGKDHHNSMRRELTDKHSCEKLVVGDSILMDSESRVDCT